MMGKMKTTFMTKSLVLAAASLLALLKADVVGGQNLTIGSQCTEHYECETSRCDSVCTCHPDTGAGCDVGYDCVYHYEQMNVTCVVLRQNLAVGSQCFAHQECATNRCKSNVCECNRNPDTDAGCEEGLNCVHDTDQDSNICVELGQNLPLGSQCYDDKECATNECDSSVCTCNPDTDVGCEEGFRCVLIISDTNRYCRKSCHVHDDCDEGQICGNNDATSEDWCYDLGDAETGDSCRYNWDCASGKCDYSCIFGLCSGICEAPPGHAEIGDDCENDEDCASGICDTSCFFGLCSGECKAPPCSEGCGFFQVCTGNGCRNIVFAAIYFVLSLPFMLFR